MTTTAYPLRIPEEIMELSRLHSRDEHTDQATTLRKFLYVGAEEYLLELVAEGRISIGRAAELLHSTVYDLHRMARRHGIELGATVEQVKLSHATGEKIFKPEAKRRR